MREIKILGAGLSGLTAAINLAKSGYKVTVFERAKDCGNRFSGDLQGLENWTIKTDVLEELRNSNIEINFDCDPFDQIILTNGEISRKIDFKRPVFYLVKRGRGKGSIDQGLKLQALENGVKILFNSRREEKEVDIVATGPSIKQTFTAVDKGIVFQTSMKDTAVALINDNAAYKGYSYLLVTKGYGCLCSVVIEEPGRLNKCFAKTIQLFRSKYDLKMKKLHNITGIGGFSVMNKFEDGEQLYVGEAAGIQEILAGFGMRSAIYSGYLAARSIVNGLSYKKVASKKFEGYVKASVVNRYIWEKVGKDNYKRIIEKVSKAKDAGSLLSKAYGFGLAHRALYPIAFSKMKKKYPVISKL